MNKSKKVVLFCSIILGTILCINAFTPILGLTSAQVVFQNGFENGNLSAWSPSGSASAITSPIHTGSYAAKATGVSYWGKSLSTSYSDLFFAGNVRIPTMLPSGQQTFFLTIQDAAYSKVAAAGLQVINGGTNWVLRVNDNWYTTSSTVQTGRWYFIEVEYNTAGTANLWVDNVLVASASRQPLSANAQIIQAGNAFGATPSGFVSYGDDFTAATGYVTAAGSASASSPAPTTSPLVTVTPTSTMAPTATPKPTTTPTATPKPSATTSPTPAPTVSPAPVTSGVSWLHTSGQNIYDNTGKQVKLYTCNLQMGDGSTYTKTDIDNIHNMGFNSIRIWVLWNQVQPNSATSINTAYFTTSSAAGPGIDSIINWAAQDGMYVEICLAWTSYWKMPTWVPSGDITCPDGGSSAGSLSLTDATTQTGLKTLYGWMGQHYASNSNVIFEGLNELCTTKDSNAGSPFANFNNAWVSAIEQGEGSNSHLKVIQFLVDYNSATCNLLVAPYISGSHSNIVIASHDYGLVDNANPSGLSSWLQTVANGAHNAGYPWIDTEFGTALGGNTAAVNTALSMMTQNNIGGWAWYCYDSITGNEGSWNLHNPSVASQMLPTLQTYMK